MVMRAGVLRCMVAATKSFIVAHGHAAIDLSV